MCIRDRNKVSKDSINGNNEVTDDIGVKTGEKNGDIITNNNAEIIHKVSGKIVENEVPKGDTMNVSRG